MTKSYGPGGKPEGRPNRPMRGSSNQEPQNPQNPKNLRGRYTDQQGGSYPPARPGQDARFQQGQGFDQPVDDGQAAQEPVQQGIDPGRRIAALILDFVAAYMLGAVISLIPATLFPWMVRFLNVQTVMMAFILGRDFLFEGRGIGKNLMGLQVIDVVTGQPANLAQSIVRNGFLIAPFIILQLTNFIFSFVPAPPWIHGLAMTIINVGGTVYTAVVLPLECYRAYKREDRKGDELAGTAIVDADMDFSTPLPRKA